MYKTPTQDQLQEQAIRRFKLPQFGSPSDSINKANSEVMQSSVQTPSNDIYSGAKQGIEKIKTGILAQTGGADAIAAEPRQVDPETPEGQVGRPQTGIKSGLGQGQDLENEAASMVRNAYESPALKGLEAATQRQAEAQRALAGFDPTQQPISKKRKAAGIATGIATGILGGGVKGGMNAYDFVTQRPALQQQQQLARKAAAEGIVQQGAEKLATATEKIGGVNKERAGVMQNVGKDTSANEQYQDTGKARVQAQTGLDNAQAAKAKADATAGIEVAPNATVIPRNQPLPYTAPGPAVKNSFQNVTIEDPKDKSKPLNAVFDPSTGDTTFNGIKIPFPRAFKSDGNDALSSYQKNNTFLNISNKYQADPIMKVSTQGATAKRVADAIIANPESATNQLASLYMYVKNLDPDSAVREGETALARQTQSYLDTWKTSIERLGSGQVLAPDAAKKLAQATKSLIEAWDKTAQSRTKQYQSQANIAQVGKEFESYTKGFEPIGGAALKVGDTKILANGKQIKITAIHEDGSFDGDEIKSPVKGKK